MLKKIVQPFYTAYAMAIFLATMAVCFPLILLISLGNNMRARRGIYMVVKYWVTAWLWAIGMPATTVGPRPPKGRYVIVANHISYLDTLVIFPALPGFFRALGKKEISAIPLIGFVYRQIVVMVDRSSARSRTKSMRLMWHALKHECDIVIFPEGTFNETEATLKEFYNGAFRLAISAQTPILPVLLPDTVHRWNYTGWWKLWPGRNRVVFLPPVPVDGLEIKDMAALRDKVFKIMEEGMKGLDV